MNEWWATWGTITATAATAWAYVLGYVSIARFANELGISASDLGLDFRAYVLLAGLNLVVWACAAGVVVLTLIVVRHAQSVSGTRLTEWAAIWLARSMGAIGAVVLLLAAAFLGIADPPGIFWILIIAIPLMIIGMSDDGWKTPGARVMIGVAIPISCAGLSITSAIQWADSLKESAAEGTTVTGGPHILALVLNPTIGTARSSNVGDEHCVIRVSDKVLLAGSEVHIRKVSAFKVERCNVDHEAFPPVTTTTSTPTASASSTTSASTATTAATAP